jgi:hypothetical protein
MVRRGKTPLDHRLKAAATAGRELWDVLQLFGDARDSIWNHLLGLCASLENNHRLSDAACCKCLDSKDALIISRLARAIDRVEDELRRAEPTLDNQLAMRLQPMLFAWEAKGPGLLHQVENLAETGLAVDQAQVVGVLPVVGGGGRALPNYHQIQIEAVLADVDTLLPEVLRLAWLLLQLHVEMGHIEDGPLDRLPEVVALSLIPITLAAGEHLDLVRIDKSTLAHAIQVWCADTHTVCSTHSVAALQTWWDTYRQNRPSWSVAVMELDRLLKDSR